MTSVILFKTPKEIVEAVHDAGVAKSKLPFLKIFLLGFLAGAYIAFGGFLAIIVGGGSTTLGKTDPGLKKFYFGAVFPVGLMLVIIAGAELFTGNTACLAPGLLSGKIVGLDFWKNWIVSYIGNFIGSVAVAYFIAYSTDLVTIEPWKSASIAIAEAKLALRFDVAMLRAVGCNWLVCLAVWLAIAATETSGKIWGIWFPIMAFVAMGFEHSVANMFFVPLGLMLGANGNLAEFIGKNLVPVTIGNVIGGFLLVGCFYYYIYLCECKPKIEKQKSVEPLPEDDISEEDISLVEKKK